MTLQTEIVGRADCAAALAARDIDALARIVSVERRANQSRFVTARTVLAECVGGQSILDALKAAAAGNSAVNWAMTFLGQEGGLDVGNPATHAMIDQLVAGTALTAAQGAALKALANLPQIVSRSDVEAALFNADGTRKP